jgi:tRNA dimethylallyltransferase
VGPTGIGKSRLAADLAEKFKGEIVNADSRQIYKYMNIGTAKPDFEEFARVPHHLYNILNPDQEFGLAQYIELALRMIENIQNRNHIPFFVGGSGQYIWSILEGWNIPRVAPDLEYRKSLEQLAADRGKDFLYNKLLVVDPVSAQKIDKRNIRRVIRALEVSNQSTIPFSQLKTKVAPNYNILIIGLTAERSRLYKMVDLRVDQMIEKGLLNEVKEIFEMGYDFSLPSLNSIGYKQVGMMMREQLKPEEIPPKIKVDTHRFIRHQYAWFSLKDERIIWFNIESHIESELEALIANHIGTQ